MLGSTHAARSKPGAKEGGSANQQRHVTQLDLAERK